MEDSLSRRDFTLKSALAMLAGVTITLTGCESDSPTAPSDTIGPTGVVGSISANHGHTVGIATADPTMSMLTLNIQGSSAHPHTIVLVMADLQQISAGTRVTVASSTDDGHAHNVTFN